MSAPSLAETLEIARGLTHSTFTQAKGFALVAGIEQAIADNQGRHLSNAPALIPLWGEVVSALDAVVEKAETYQDVAAGLRSVGLESVAQRLDVLSGVGSGGPVINGCAEYTVELKGPVDLELFDPNVAHDEIDEDPTEPHIISAPGGVLYSDGSIVSPDDSDAPDDNDPNLESAPSPGSDTAGSQG